MTNTLTSRQLEDLERILAKRRRDSVNFEETQDEIPYFQYVWKTGNDRFEEIRVGFVEDTLCVLDYRTWDAYELDDDYHEGIQELDLFVKINHLKYRRRWGMVHH